MVHLQKDERRVWNSVCAERGTEFGGDARQLSAQGQPSQTVPEGCAREGKKKKVGTQGNDKKEVWWKSPKIKVEKREGVMLRNTRQLLQAKAKRVTNPGRCD